MGFPCFDAFRCSFGEACTDDIPYGLAEAGYGGSLEGGAEGASGATGGYAGGGSQVCPVAASWLWATTLSHLTPPMPTLPMFMFPEAAICPARTPALWVVEVRLLGGCPRTGIVAREAKDDSKFSRI